MAFRIQRIYDASDSSKALRILVDRLWPRGVSKTSAALDDWQRDLAPSDDLRKWFGHDPAKWMDFRQRYLAELHTPALAIPLRDLAERGRTADILLLYAAHDPLHNNAIVLKEALDHLLTQ
ncbi:MAG: DUF488 family protein [Verrucomicrobiales bacterium]|nr:DUF488 family protein [Verrucomicrobiales bacterium]